jgi:hypothetical protein
MVGCVLVVEKKNQSSWQLTMLKVEGINIGSLWEFTVVVHSLGG